MLGMRLSTQAVTCRVKAHVQPNIVYEHFMSRGPFALAYVAIFSWRFPKKVRKATEKLLGEL